MQHYVPGFILQECEEKRYAGSITAFALFFDIADFTQTSNIFRRLGSKGAEALSNYLTAAFAYPIMQVESQGGYVSHFAGDAFCAIFPGSDSRGIRQALSNIQGHFTDKAYLDLELGEFPISIRLILTHGEVEWKILQNRIQHEYVFTGSPLQEIYNLSNHKEACMLSPAVQKSFADAPKGVVEVSPLSFAYSETTRQLFTKAKLMVLEVENEIRDAAYCFVDLSRIEESKLEAVLESIHTKLEDYSGFLNKIDATDKGLVALVLFGLPKAIGNTLERMCRFALEMITDEPKLGMGLACGSAYAGYVGCADTREFTALGSAVNLASRLMQKAGVGEIVTDSYLQQEMHYKYRFVASETVKLKGFAVEVHSHKLLGRLPKPPQNFHTDFVGREAEIESLRKEAKEPGSRIIYISGEPGMGKSRLIIEALKAFPQSYFLFSDPSVHRLLEPIKQMVGQYFAIDPLFSKHGKLKLFRQQWQELAQDDKELIRIESIIGQLLGYEWERSVWSVLPPEEKPEQLKNAFVSFISRITRDAKLIMHLDDPQWLDDSTLEFFRLLGEKNVEGVTMFAACRYLDDGNAVDLEIPNWESKHVDLALLTPETAAVMIKQILGVESIPEDSLDWIVRKADGNPLFLEQVVAYLKENNCFDVENKLVGNLDYLSSFGIADIIGSRIDSLTENVRNTLQHACVLGLEFNTKVLCEMLSRKLDEDLGKGKQAKVWADLDELRYIFTHVLIKDTAYNRMLSDKLKGLHLLAAEAMVKLYKDDEKILNEHSEEIAIHYNEAGEDLEAAKYYDMAGVNHTESYRFEYAERTLKLGLLIREKIYGEEHPDTAMSLHNLAKLLHFRGKYQQAQEVYLKALTIMEKCTGYEDAVTVLFLNDLAALYGEQGMNDQSKQIYLKALAICEKVLGSEHSFTATIMTNLAHRIYVEGNYSESEALNLKALAIKEKILRSDHPDRAVTLNNMGALYTSLGKYDLAEIYYRRALVIRENHFGLEHPDTAMVIDNLADLFRVQGKYDQALPLCLTALNMREKILGIEHPDTTLSINNLALLYYYQNMFDQAEHLFLKALALREKMLGAEHPYIATSLNNLASFYHYQGKHEKVECMLKRALVIREKALGKEHPETASTINSLAFMHFINGHYINAERMFLEALSIREKVIGSEHLDTAASFHCLGLLHLKVNRHEKALPLLVNALSIRRKAQGIEHPDTQKTIQALVETYDKLNMPEKAEEYKAMLVEIKIE